MPISTPSKPATADQPSSPWLAALPVLFVFFWATGFIGGKYGLPHAGTFTFLTLRFLIVIALLTVIALAMGAPWPKRHEILPLAIGGVFVHAAYLGSVFLSISNGVEAGVSAMMAGLQPLLTAMVAGPVLGEKEQDANGPDCCWASPVSPWWWKQNWRKGWVHRWEWPSLSWRQSC